MSQRMDRRDFLKTSFALSTAASVAASGAGAGSSKPNASAKDESGGPDSDKMPHGEIAGQQFSRLILGGNLINHYTHSRDLDYVYDLAARYNTEEKILDTLELAEKHGISWLVADPLGCQPTLMKYRRERGGDIRWVMCPHADPTKGIENYMEEAEQLVENGASALYVWGVRGDRLYRQDRIDLIKQCVAVHKGLGVPSGVGAHDLRVIEACEEYGVGADFYVKTFHHHDYPTAPEPDEIEGPYSEIPGYWCRNPNRTAEVMEEVDKPWIAFKVMAAGAIPPKSAFPYVLNNGADHILAGMFDFEIAEDAKIAREAIAQADRSRPWRS